MPPKENFRPIVYVIFVITIHVLTIAPVSNAFAGNFFDPPLKPNRMAPWMAWLLTSNDGFGHNYGTDEDSLRSFGLHLGVMFLHNGFFTLKAQSLTDRSDQLTTSKRIDELKTLVGWRFWFFRVSSFSWSLLTGVGGFLSGDFGSRKIQEGVHKPDERPVPKNVDISSKHLLGFVFTDVYFPKQLTMKKRTGTENISPTCTASTSPHAFLALRKTLYRQRKLDLTPKRCKNASPTPKNIRFNRSHRHFRSFPLTKEGKRSHNHVR